MKERLQRFMVGRYGADDFSKFQLITMLVLMIFNVFIGSLLIDALGMVLIGYYFYRAFSRNVQKRYQENMIYLQYKNKVMRFFKGQKNLMNQRKTHHIYSCPGCKQKIRIPKGKGKIVITCPKCKTEFTKRS